MRSIFSFNEINEAIKNKSEIIILSEDDNKKNIDIDNIEDIFNSGAEIVFGKYSNIKLSIIDHLKRFLLFFPFTALFRIKHIYPCMIAFKKGYFNKNELNDIDDSSNIKIKILSILSEKSKKIEYIDLKNEKKKNKKNIKLREIYKIRSTDKKTLRFLKFAIVGFVGYIVNAGFLEIFLRTGFTQHLTDQFLLFKDVKFLNVLNQNTSWSAGFSIEISIISNFILNNFWTFSGDRIKGLFNIIGKFLQFNLTSIGAIVIQFFTVGFATMIIGNTLMVRQAAVIFSIVFMIIPYNWLMYNKIIWNNKN